MGICPQSLTFSTVILYHCHYQYCKSKGLSSSIIFEFILITGTVKLCGAAKQTQVLQLQLHISVELPPSVLDIVRPGLGTHSHSPLVLCTFTPLIESRSYLLNFSVWNNQLISVSTQQYPPIYVLNLNVVVFRISQHSKSQLWGSVCAGVRGKWW